ncbi:hypothetical protein ACU4GD_01595 [Cupriavidus basilensis]
MRIGILVRDATMNEDPVAVKRNAEQIAGLREKMGTTLDELGKWLSTSGRPETRDVSRS